jgi:predicted site-specific integrase-resolvase
VRRWLREGKLPRPARLGRRLLFNRSDVEARLKINANNTDIDK